MYLQNGALMYPNEQLSERMSQICEVYCTYCHDSLGTMDMLAIVDAVRAKGSILCPSCRAGCCVACGEPGLRRNSEGVCLFCYVESDTSGGFASWSPACPTDQKSTHQTMVSEKPVWERCEVCGEEKSEREIKSIQQMGEGQEPMSVCVSCYLSFSQLDESGLRVCDGCGRVGASYQVSGYADEDSGRLVANLCSTCHYEFTGGTDV